MFQSCIQMSESYFWMSESCFGISSRYLRVPWFILILIYYSGYKYWLSCFRKTKAKNKCITARFIWQLVIHRCAIFAYIISRWDGKNNGALAGISFPPSLSTPCPRISLRPKIPIIFTWTFPLCLCFNPKYAFQYTFKKNNTKNEKKKKKTRENKEGTFMTIFAVSYPSSY